MLDKQASYWDSVAQAWQEEHPQALWRVHSDAVYSALFAQWLPDHTVERLLKTDLFDETYGQGLYPLLASRAEVVMGTDLATLTVRAARSRHSDLIGMEADVRRLPFADDTFDVIVSNSTLDHFESLDQLLVGLAELYRVLASGGQLLLSLDNLANPAIAVRNALPSRLMERLRTVVPYYVGATCGPGRLQRVLREVGFEVVEVTALMHHPSILAVAMARLLQRRASPATRRRFLRLLMSLEHLSRLPTRFVTGHYVAVRAVKRLS